MADAKIGRGTWIDKLASELLEREKSLGRDTRLLRVESGLGASGIPHIGSLGDAVRAYGVKLALNDAGYDSELVAYSDDLDGLRKVPAGMPDSLSEHIGKPVSSIPDPYGCCKSYGAHMSSLLLEGLDKLGIRYTFQSAADAYSRGLFAENIHTILSNAARIGSQISEMTGQEKFRLNLPYFPVCASCGRLYTAKAQRYLEEEKKVAYTCGDADVGGSIVSGCGHKGEADIKRDPGKLAWKVEFAARWRALDIRFEAYGKDIMDSVKINDWVSDEILGYAHPHHIKYEMFLDKGGKKISKSAGNVLTVQKWLRYGTSRSILLLLYKRIKGARELGLEDVPSLMDEYNHIEDIYFGKAKLDNEAKLVRTRGLYEYVNLLEPPKAPDAHVSYMLLVELARIFKEDRENHVMKKLIEYGTIRGPDDYMINLIGLAGAYADDFGESEKTKVELDDSARAALAELARILESEKFEDLQNMIYELASSHNIKPREFFVILYKVILNTSRGPRLGPFIADIGAAKVARMIRENI